IPTYMLASGLIAGGMSWKQAIGTILLGNLIVLVPMILNAHAGTKYGIPFPVYVRASFGVRGANVPAVLRALVACGWFGIQAWIGGQAIYSMLTVLWPAAADHAGVSWACFFAFWLLNMLVIWRGIETIKFLEGVGAPFMLGVGLLLLWWITRKAGGLGPVLSTPSKFKTTSEFFRFFVPSLTGMVGFWATVALNIPDFTRYAKSQKAQMTGQALGLPTAMTIYSFIGVRSEEHTSELQSLAYLVCRLLLEKKKSKSIPPVPYKTSVTSISMNRPSPVHPIPPYKPSRQPASRTPFPSVQGTLLACPYTTTFV